MPNRILKESIKRSPQIDSLTWFEEVVFYRLMVTADDYGCTDGRVVVLKNDLFPTKDTITKKTVEDAIEKLVNVGLVCKYIADGIPYLYLTTWEKHQRVRNKNRKYPEPTENRLTADCCQTTADCPHESNPIQSESNTVDSPPSSKIGKRDLDSFFEQVWGLYPKKEGKGQVGDAQKKKLYAIGPEEMTRAINRYIKAKDGKDRQFLQNGSTFFNSGYVDYLDANYQFDEPKSTTRAVDVPEGW